MSATDYEQSTQRLSTRSRYGRREREREERRGQTQSSRLADEADRLYYVERREIVLALSYSRENRLS